MESGERGARSEGGRGLDEGPSKITPKTLFVHSRSLLAGLITTSRGRITPLARNLARNSQAEN